MKCPHCDHVASHKVVETRKYEGSVYRRRRCDACSCGFVSVETTDTHMIMPTAVSYHGRAYVPVTKTRRPRGVSLADVWKIPPLTTREPNDQP